MLSQTAYLRRFLFHLYHLLETIFFALFHTASTLSGSLRSPPSPRGEGFVSRIPLSPSNLRPFGAPPSIGRRECPHEPLPLEGAAERSEAGLASFLGGEAASSLPSLLGKALCREKRHPRIAAFPIGKVLPGETVSSFLHPFHIKTTVSYERPFLCVLLA